MQPGTDLRAELARQLRDLRMWLLIVGALLFGIDVVGMSVSSDAEMTLRWERWLLVYYLMILGYFIVMWWGARTRPVVWCTVALGGYWVMHACLWIISPEPWTQGILVKLIIMAGLIKCAHRASRLEGQVAMHDAAS